uniref:BCL2 interacting protein 3 n=1 Tax=Coturnix japonica TaxID=93934 RepID=A0A8C2SQR8_COTJA
MCAQRSGGGAGRSGAKRGGTERGAARSHCGAAAHRSSRSREWRLELNHGAPGSHPEQDGCRMSSSPSTGGNDEKIRRLLLPCSSLCSSPPRSQTPLDSHRALEIESHSSGEKNSFQSEEDFLERRKEVERLLKKNADWIWDWSSRPENIPPKEFLFKHPRRTATLSMRNTSVMKKGGIFSAEFLKVFLPSLLLSHLLAIGLGIYIGRRLTTTASSSSF